MRCWSSQEYEPYDPPRVGITAQLYGVWPGPRGCPVDAVALSRQATLAASGDTTPPGLLAQAQRVYDGAHGAVVKRVKAFAEQRGAGDSAYGWRKYLVSQQCFIEYCCYATLRALLSVQDDSVLAVGHCER